MEGKETVPEKKQRKPRAKSKFVLLQGHPETDAETLTIKARGTSVKQLRAEATKLGEGVYQVVCLHDAFEIKQTVAMQIIKA